MGTWRVENLADDSATVESVLEGIALTRPNVVYEKPICKDRECKIPVVRNYTTLKSQGLGHGSMLHARVDPATCADNQKSSQGEGSTSSSSSNNGEGTTASDVGNTLTKRVIAHDGSIQLVHDPNAKSVSNGNRGFRKGMAALRDMKMQWTLQEFVDMDERFVFKIKRQEECWIANERGVSLDSDSCNDFQSYLRKFNFQRNRFAFLYGRFVDFDEDDDTKDSKDAKKRVIVEAIYEPPQEPDSDTPEGFIQKDDPMEENVEKIAQMIGLQRVGWILGHPPRVKGFQMSAAEVIMAAELQIEAADGVEPTPFVTVKATLGDDGNVSFEAFQVSRQCMEMVAEGAISVGENPGFCAVSDTFTAIQEGKESKTVENNFFLTVVPIVQHSSEKFVSQFPKPNRDHDARQQTNAEMKNQLSKSGSAGWTFMDLLSDFNLLIYLSKFLDPSDIAEICGSVSDRDIPLKNGHKIIIAGLAGLDASY
eukprot:CAMPEP_0197825444 /NCGR_PEP_ID=MMETSP1437-20131217/2527_1 /TAXON_ID=49252 ORGANISM="Eucampia antarctica, Strain CCMP1452" /NCGR_SAMPLE_ID=MMETSP1437 /ASSEMBLY_ACC=CAM_ASM_001096 /LENGTH=479 /DNA_ID=CAMNT_0043425443 /DNA_START=155 /DNA_END=1594 /DNA_ORIENTATION=+